MITVNSFVKKIILLEEKLGAKIGYTYLEPFTLNTNDIISIQLAAKKIAEFLGLNQLIFIVSVVKQKENVGGNIELRNYEREVYIEITKDAIQYSEAVLAILAHEIAHKYLHLNRIDIGEGIVNEYENEILTDIATVFLGLGKLSMNGCECYHRRIENSIEGERTITESFKTGYLDQKQFSFVFLLVAKMRKIPSEIYEKGLSVDALAVLSQSKERNDYYLGEKFEAEDIKENLVKQFISPIEKLQSTLADIDRILIYLKHSLIEHTDEYLNKQHKYLKNVLLDFNKLKNAESFNPSLKFLHLINLDETIANLMSVLRKKEDEVTIYQQSLENTVAEFKKSKQLFRNPPNELFEKVFCRNDGTEIKFKKDNNLKTLKCPVCKYEFIAKPFKPEFLEDELLEKTKKGISRNFLDAIKKWIRKIEEEED